MITVSRSAPFTVPVLLVSALSAGGDARAAAAAPAATPPAATAPVAAGKGSPATRYAVDAARSSLEFSFVQAGAQNKGHFKAFGVSFEFTPDNPAAGRLDVTVDTKSLDTGDPERDDTLRGADLFNVAKYPQSRFTATQIARTAAGYLASGTLTLRGVTRPLAVPFTFRAATEQGAAAGYMNGRVTLRRLDFGVGQGDWKSTEGVGNDVTVSFALRLAATR